MTPEDQRIAIAEACGWSINPEGWSFDFPGDAVYVKGGDCVEASRLPDYLNDLNACHEFEGTLLPRLHLRYIDNLVEITDSRELRLISATAAQRAEAFLRTLSLWTE